VPDWVEPVARYMLDPGLTGTLRIAAFALVGSALIGVILGTLLTVDFVPLRASQIGLGDGVGWKSRYFTE